MVNDTTRLLGLDGLVGIGLSCTRMGLPSSTCPLVMSRRGARIAILARYRALQEGCVHRTERGQALLRGEV